MNVTALLIVMDSEPAVALAPDQFPDAVQLLASVEDQLRLMALPRDTLDGLAVRLTVGAGVVGGWFTVTVTLSLALPPSPLQASV